MSTCSPPPDKACFACSERMRSTPGPVASMTPSRTRSPVLKDFQGDLSVDDAHMDMSAPSNKLVVKVSHMDMEKMMKLMDIEGVSGKGILNGQIPLEIFEDRGSGS